MSALVDDAELELTPEPDWQQVTAAVKGLNHVLRLRTLHILRDRGVVTPKALAAELGQPLENVSYHVRTLAKMGLIKLTRRRMGRRGAIEHLYEISPRGREAYALALVLSTGLWEAGGETT